MTLYARVMCVLWGCTIAAIAQNAFHHAYDVMRGETLCVGVWRVGDGDELGAQPQNVTWTPFGSLPHGIVHVVQETQFPTPATVWEGLLTGSVAATETHMMHTHRVDIQFDQLTNHHEYTYTTLLRVDEHANTPRDTNHLTVLAVQTTWSENSGWVNGHLYPGEQFGQQLLPADVDVFRVDTDAGVYCVETEANFDIIEPALSIVVFKKAAGQDAYDGEWIARTNHYNIYGSSGTIDMRRQRVYFTLDNDSGAYVQISPGEGISPRTYRVRVFRARPVILVHGIECYPKVAERDLPLGRNALGHWNDYLPWDGLAYPCVCYPLCWDSHADDLVNEDVLNRIVLDVNQLQEQHKMNVVLIGHSMGGFFVRHALQNVAEKVYRAATLGTPHYGSEIANMCEPLPLAPWFKRTSRPNLKVLKRGSQFVWNMNGWAGREKLLCMAGVGAPPRVTVGYYTDGLRDSDGVVPLSSGLLADAQNVAVRIADHGTIALATYVPLTCYPYDASPAGFVGTVWSRVFSDDKNTSRLPAQTVLGNALCTRIYHPIREFIK